MKTITFKSETKTLISIIEAAISKTNGFINNQIKLNNPDESKIFAWSIQIPAPYSKGADPTGEKNQQEYIEYHIKFLETIMEEMSSVHIVKELLTGIKTDLDLAEDDHIFIYNIDETAEIHFNDSILNIIYHYTGQW